MRRMASQAEEDLRKRILNELIVFMDSSERVPPNMLRQILMETIESCFIFNPKEGWKSAVVPLLNKLKEPNLLLTIPPISTKDTQNFLNTMINQCNPGIVKCRKAKY